MALSDYVDPLIKYLTGTGTNSLLGDITDNAGNIALGGAGLGLLSNAYSRLGNIGDESQAGANIIAQQGLQQSQFRPFTVTSTTGSQFGFTPAALPSYTTPYAPPSMFPTDGGGGGYVPPSTTFPGTDFAPGESIGPDRLIPAQRSQLFSGVIRDAQFIDNNNNGIDDRDEQPLAPLGSSARLTLSPQEEVMQDMLQQQAESAMLGGPFGEFQRQLAAQQAFGLGGQFMGAAAQQPADINLLRGQFAGQVGGMLGQQPSPAIGQFGQQALGLGMAGLDTQAPSDVEALRRQYTQLASQTAGRALQDTAGREADVYERIRATQRPEEERQRLALEERMAQQGRLGVRTAMFGGAPEQFALAQAQEEAQNRASLMAMQQAQAERQQAVSEAQTFGGLFGQQAGLSSQLQSAAQQRAAQLSQLGLSAQQIESQLQSEGLGRAATSAQQAAQLAQLAGGLQAQQAGLGAQYAGLGSQLAMQDLAAQQAQQQYVLGALAGSYIPQAQLMNVAQLGMTPIEMAQRGQLYGAGLFGEGSMAGLQSRLAAALGQANLFGTVGTGLLSGALGVKI
jgi:hypothetical protein